MTLFHMMSIAAFYFIDIKQLYNRAVILIWIPIMDISIAFIAWILQYFQQENFTLKEFNAMFDASPMNCQKICCIIYK